MLPKKKKSAKKDRKREGQSVGIELSSENPYMIHSDVATHVLRRGYWSSDRRKGSKEYFLKKWRNGRSWGVKTQFWGFFKEEFIEKLFKSGLSYIFGCFSCLDCFVTFLYLRLNLKNSC